MADFALGIPKKENLGDLTQLTEGELYDFVVQEHQADKAGRHYDLRIGSHDTGLFSWAVPQGKLPGPGERLLAVRQPLHDYSYRKFEGIINKGYGKGSVSKVLHNRILVTHIEPNKKLVFVTADERHPRRFMLLKPSGEHWDDKSWILMNITPTKHLPYVKEQMPQWGEDHFKANLLSGAVKYVEPKIDGAHAIIVTGIDNLDVYSHRVSRTTNNPIVHTERMFGTRPKFTLPTYLVGSVLRGELFGVVRDENGVEKIIPPQELSAILNSSVYNALKNQKYKGITLKVALFDINQYGKQYVDHSKVPYVDRLKMLNEILKHLPKDKFILIPYTDKPDVGLLWWTQIKNNEHPLTSEGIVAYDEYGRTHKIKARKETDVYIRKIEPGKGKYSNTAGAVAYSREPKGPIVGTVGTGFTDEFRDFLWENRNNLIGRRAIVTYQEEYPSGALRGPSFISLHEDYPTQNEKTASGECVLPPEDPEWFKVIDTLECIRFNRRLKKLAGEDNWLDIPIFTAPTKAFTKLESLIGGPNTLTSVLLSALASSAVGAGLGKLLLWLAPDIISPAAVRRLAIAFGSMGGAWSLLSHSFAQGEDMNLLKPSPIHEARMKAFGIKKQGGLPDPKQLFAFCEDVYGIKIDDVANKDIISKALEKQAAGFDASEWGKTVLDDKYLNPWEKTMAVTIPMVASIHRGSDWVTVGDIARVTANMKLGDVIGRIIGNIAVPVLGLNKSMREEFKMSGRLAGMIKGVFSPIREVALRSSAYENIAKSLQI